MNLSQIDSQPTLSTQQKTGPSGRFWVFRAEDEIRTRDLLLGKETLHPVPNPPGVQPKRFRLPANKPTPGGWFLMGGGPIKRCCMV